MYEAIFHPAIWMPAALLIVGVAVFIYGNARVQTKVRLAGVGIVALMLVWCGVAYAIDTPLEQCLNRTKAICAAVENARWTELKMLIDKTTVIDRVGFRGPDGIATGVQNNAEAYGLKSIRVLSTDWTIGSGSYDVTINTYLEGTQPTTARFTFQYEQRSDGILLAHIVPLSVANMTVDDFITFVRRAGGH